MKSIIFSVPILTFLLLLTMPYVYAGGPRLDYGDDVTEEAADCWVQGYD